MANVRDFGAMGDGVADDTNAVEHALAEGDGTLHFPPGDYRLTRTVRVDLAKRGRWGMDGSAGTARLIMEGAGPAFHIVGTHDKTADPTGFKPDIWTKERLPTCMHLEIAGRNPRASGFLLEGTMQATFVGVLLRQLYDAIRLRGRVRNLLISHCHIYDNHHVGVFFDQVNLHQAIITGSHISYCKAHGIAVVGSEIRNLQITGNDIEYNHDPKAQDCADVLIDCSAAGATVREGTIVSNTIQAKVSPSGANVRMVGFQPEFNHKAGMFTISNNILGSQDINLHLVACRGVVVNGNVLYSGWRRNLRIEGSRNIVVGPNSFDHNPDYGAKELCTGIELLDSRDLTLTGLQIHDCRAGQHTVATAPPLHRDGLLEIHQCQRVTVSSCQILDGAPVGIHVRQSRDVSVSQCMILESREPRLSAAAVRWTGAGSGNLLSGNRLGKGREGTVLVEANAGLTQQHNLHDE